MMKRITLWTSLIFMAFALAACGQAKEEEAAVTQQEDSVQAEDTEKEAAPEEGIASESEEEACIKLEDPVEIDFTHDYTEDIKADVSYVAENSVSLQEELENIDIITQKYHLLADAASTQGEMNLAAQWLYTIWDAELNSLWNRFSSLAEEDTKERVLGEQRNWIGMKEEVTFLCLGSQEENGSMYPLLVNSLWEEKTRNRAYVIANELAQVIGEAFVLPEASEKYGVFVDNQDSSAVYSSLITQQSVEGEDTAFITVFRQGAIEGNFADNGNGTLSFSSDDGSIRGTIQINGWEGATFKVVETTGEVPFSVGEEFEFPFAF